MKKKLLITAVAAILSVSSIAGGTMAVYTAATHTDKTISTSSIGVSLNIDEDTGKKEQDKVNTSQRVPQRVSVKNTGQKPQYVRVKINKEWMDKDEVITKRDGEKLNKDYIGIDYVNTDDWIYVEPEMSELSETSDLSETIATAGLSEVITTAGLSESEDSQDKEKILKISDVQENKDESLMDSDAGYLYYKKIVYPGESTSDFMDAYTVLEDVNENTNIYSDMSVNVDYTAEAIQTVAAKAAMLYEWGVIADITDDGGINNVRNARYDEEYEITDNITQIISDVNNTSLTEADKNITELEKNATAISLDSSATGFSVVEKDIDFKDMQPGETREGLVRLYNNSDKKMDFYINSEIIKNIAGEGSKTGIYNIKIYKAMEDKDYELLYDGIISGANESENHITDSNNITDKDSGAYILTGDEYLATLSGGESAGIRIFITLDGKSMDNSYMNKQGQLRLNISAVQNVTTDDTDRTTKTVKTGDSSMLMFFGVLAVVAGVAALGTLAGLCARRKIKNNASKEL